jgi:capsular polysaccharide biosynthesis protein
MVRRSGIDPGSIDHFVVNPFNPLQSHVYWEGLAEAGVASERVVFCEPTTVFALSEVVATSNLRGTGHNRRWVCEWLNHTFGQGSSSGGRRVRLYVGRDDAVNRRLKNQSEIFERVLSPLGFEHVWWNGRSIREQAALFGSADVIVAANGAALANIVYCRPGTRVIVLHRPAYLSSLFYELSHTAGLNYYHLTGEATTPEKPEDSPSDFFVNPQSLVELLKLAEVS